MYNEQVINCSSERKKRGIEIVRGSELVECVMETLAKDKRQSRGESGVARVEAGQGTEISGAAQGTHLEVCLC